METAGLWKGAGERPTRFVIGRLAGDIASVSCAINDDLAHEAMRRHAGRRSQREEKRENAS